MVGDGSYLMMSTRDRDLGPGRLQLIVVLVDNHGYACIGGLSRVARRRSASAPRYRYRGPGRPGRLDGAVCRSTSPPTPPALARDVVPRRTTCVELRTALEVALAGDASRDRDQDGSAQAWPSIRWPGGTCRSQRCRNWQRLGAHARATSRTARPSATSRTDRRAHKADHDTTTRGRRAGAADPPRDRGGSDAILGDSSVRARRSAGGRVALAESVDVDRGCGSSPRGLPCLEGRLDLQAHGRALRVP